jgi:hypothetical protein
MTTSLALLALSSFLASSTGAEKPNWLTDYAVARQLGRVVQKPLAVVVGSGQEGWEKLSQEGKLGKETNRLLAANYVCVYLDTTSSYGQRLAGAFNLTQGSGLVLSNRAGELQAFHHSGNLGEASLGSYLRRYAEPQHVVRQTESATVERVSYYPPSYQSVAPTQYAPTQFAPAQFSPAVSGGRNC